MYNLIITVITILNVANSEENVYFKIFNPQNYMNQLPSLSLPYINNMTIPSLKIPELIKPSPVVPTTKVINVVTKYVTKNPVCIKVRGKKLPCGLLNNGTLIKSSNNNYNSGNNKNNMEYVISKVYFVKNKIKREINIEGSEESSNLENLSKQTPILNISSIKEVLIEDRLDHLQSILPYYTRPKVYQTKTITVTKQMDNNRVRATLMVKNCIPRGIPLCERIENNNQKRKTKPIHKIN